MKWIPASLRLGAWIVALLLAYLFFWPVPIDPVTWNAPIDKGLIDPFEPNDRLRKVRNIDFAATTCEVVFGFWVCNRNGTPQWR